MFGDRLPSIIHVLNKSSDVLFFMIKYDWWPCYFLLRGNTRQRQAPGLKPYKQSFCCISAECFPYCIFLIICVPSQLYIATILAVNTNKDIVFYWSINLRHILRSHNSQSSVARTSWMEIFHLLLYILQ